MGYGPGREINLIRRLPRDERGGLRLLWGACFAVALAVLALPLASALCSSNSLQKGTAPAWGTALGVALSLLGAALLVGGSRLKPAMDLE